MAAFYRLNAGQLASVHVEASRTLHNFRSVWNKGQRGLGAHVVDPLQRMLGIFRPVIGRTVETYGPPHRKRRDSEQ